MKSNLTHLQCAMHRSQKRHLEKFEAARCGLPNKFLHLCISSPQNQASITENLAFIFNQIREIVNPFFCCCILSSFSGKYCYNSANIHRTVFLDIHWKHCFRSRDDILNDMIFSDHIIQHTPCSLGNVLGNTALGTGQYFLIRSQGQISENLPAS